MCSDTGNLACDGCHLEHPLDRLACAVVKQAILDTRIIEPMDWVEEIVREAALRWLRNEGKDWMLTLAIQPEPILRRVERG
jgi:hypothetical protein